MTPSCRINTAVKCALILNELVSNALKHAFPNGRKGEIHIEFWSSRENGLTLLVGDNGIGFPDSLDYRQVDTLGLKLVTTLAEQLDGTFEMNRNEGTEIKITFPVQ